MLILVGVKRLDDKLHTGGGARLVAHPNRAAVGTSDSSVLYAHRPGEAVVEPRLSQSLSP